MTAGQYAPGLTDDGISRGVTMFLAKQGLTGLVTEQQATRFLEAVRANEAMLQIGREMDQQVQADVLLQERIAQLAAKYLPVIATNAAVVTP
jgi:hypothetical protein